MVPTTRLRRLNRKQFFNCTLILPSHLHSAARGAPSISLLYLDKLGRGQKKTTTDETEPGNRQNELGLYPK